MRSCLGCRQAKEQAQLVRMVRSPEGEILVDLKGRLPGRGAYLCMNRACISAAVRKQQFTRAFRQPCLPVEATELLARIAQELLAHMAALLGMARKSATVVAGSNAVLEAMTRKAPPAVVILAKDISPQIGDKVRRKAENQGIVLAELFDKSELGRILGRAERSVVGLPDSKLADAFRFDLLRYQDIQGKVDG